MSETNASGVTVKSGDFFDLVRFRQSIRAFQPLPVEEEKLQRIIAAANSAPSAGNLQGYEMVVIRQPEMIKALVPALFNQAFVAQAPLLLMFCTNARRSAVKYGHQGGEFFSLQDATIACAYAELAAAQLGLGTVWIGAIDVPAVQRITGISADWKPVALLPIGYRAETPASTSRRPLSDILHEAVAP
jgi:nitroreductase